MPVPLQSTTGEASRKVEAAGPRPRSDGPRSHLSLSRRPKGLMTSLSHGILELLNGFHQVGQKIR